MRDVRALLAKNASAERVADYKWRSPEEIAFYLRSVTAATKVEATSGLDRAKLTKAYGDLVALQAKLDSLHSLDVVAAQDFGKHRERLASLIADARKDLEQKRDKALRILQKSAMKNEPVELREAVANARAMLQTRLVHQQGISDYVYATSYGNNGFEFNHYIQIDGLHNPYVGFTYPEYYVVITARQTPAGVTLHANTLHDFRAPGSFNIGDRLDADQLPTVITALLHADEFVDEQDGVELPNIPLDVRLFKTPVKNLCIQQNNITGELYGVRAEAIAYSKALLLELQAAFGRCLPGYSFKCKLTPRGKERWSCAYMAVAVPGKNVLTAQGERVLRNQLNLNTEQITAIRRLLIKGY